MLVIGQRQYSSYQQHAEPEANHKGSHGYQGHPKEEAPAPYEESIRHKETTKEKIIALPRTARTSVMVEAPVTHLSYRRVSNPQPLQPGCG